MRSILKDALKKKYEGDIAEATSYSLAHMLPTCSTSALLP